MDDLSFPSAGAVPPIPLAAGALPPSSAAIPRSAAPNLTLPIGVTTKVASKPGRYEDGLDTRPLTPPSSSHNLQLVFDSSKIYDNHPRKYRLLLETDKDNDSHTSHLFQSASSSSDATTSPSVTVEDGRVVAMGTTSSGPVEDPSPMPDAGVAAGVPKLGATSAPSKGAPFTLSEAVSSVSVKKEQGQSRYVPQEFLQSFTAATKLGPPSDQESHKRALPLSGPSSSAEMPPSIGMPSAGIIHPSTAPIPQIHAPERHEMPSGCVVVQPEPRRLFGFGPFYRPLPETHCVPGGRRQSSPTLTVPGGLSEAVTKEGITAAGHPGGRRASAAVDSTDGGGAGVAAGVTTGTAAGVNKRVGGHKKPPTPAELNVWLGGSF